MAAVWREVLGVERVGVHDNFFDLGGTRLLLDRVYSRLRELRADLKVVDLFRHPTVERAGGAPGRAAGRRRRRTWPGARPAPPGAARRCWPWRGKDEHERSEGNAGRRDAPRTSPWWG